MTATPETAITSLVVAPEARKSLGERVAQAAIDLSIVRALKYDTEEDRSLASSMMHHCREIWKYTEDERTKITKPLNEAKRAVDALFKPILNAMVEAEREIKASLIYASEEQERKNEAARQEAMRLALASDTRAASAVLAQVKDTAPPEGLYFREVWDFEVTDAKEIPRAYLTIDRSRIESYVDHVACSGLDPEIAGIRFFKRKIPVAKKP